MKFVLASSNAHKGEEIALLLREVMPDAELTLQTELGVESPVESGSTFVENALIKAKHASRVTGLPAIADDSGICVHALDGVPGIYSARYAGPDASDEDNLNKLLSAMAGQKDRRAFFYCVLVSLQHHEDPCPLIAEGDWQGAIAQEPAGQTGFGYDPIFFDHTYGKTAAQLTGQEKNAISHRGKALQTLVEKLSAQYPA